MTDNSENTVELTIQISPIAEQILHDFCKSNNVTASEAVKKAILGYLPWKDHRRLAEDGIAMSKTITDRLSCVLDDGDWVGYDAMVSAEMLRSIIGRML